MTRIISAPTETGQLRHYFVRESTLDGWRPQCGQWARLDRCGLRSLSQAAYGDVVEVIRTVTPPTGFHNDEEGCLWLEHRGGSSAVPGDPDRRHERRNVGTVGVWEHVVPIVLATWPEGSRLEQLSSEDRVAVLVAAFEELPPEERRAFVKRSTIGLADFDDCKEEDEGEMPEPII